VAKIKNNVPARSSHEIENNFPMFAEQFAEWYDQFVTMSTAPFEIIQTNLEKCWSDGMSFNECVISGNVIKWL
jgi:hypothetical protein